MNWTGSVLNVGDIISIPCDQYGRPVMAFDGSAGLQRFIVTATDMSTVMHLRPYLLPTEPCALLRGMVYKAAR